MKAHTNPNANPIAAVYWRALASAGTWVSRSELDAAARITGPMADDELADLVLQGRVEFNARSRSYRLVGTPAARLALRNMLANGVERHVQGSQSRDGKTYHLGIAMLHKAMTADEMVVMLEIDMPYPGAAAVAEMALRFA